MKKKLFISNLDFEVTSDQLQEIFQEVGSAKSVVIATDKETKKSRGFAFVEMNSESDAQSAIDQLNGRELNGRAIKVAGDKGKGGSSTGGSSSYSGGGSSGGGDRRPQREYLPPIQRMALFRRKGKLDPFMEDPTKTVDYRDISMLTKFTSDRGRILPRRQTGLTAYNQRKVAKAIKRAQAVGLMPYRNQ
ncbi:MAG: 30S ribosomal protein S18 [Bdellovibrionota bacterium]